MKHTQGTLTNVGNWIGVVGTTRPVFLTQGQENWSEDAKRLIEIWNALDGVENPKEFIDQAKERNAFDAQFDIDSAEVLSKTENADEYLRSQGLDPEEIGKQGLVFVNTLVAKIKGEERIKKLESVLKSTRKLNLHVYQLGTIGNTVYQEIEAVLKPKAED